ncbi:MAG: DUF4255 domain-containing protein [Calditrichaeota bacterium]|nr:DUF4255 domain-containing protein [Calditrichota bacterium]MCB9088568.1 DUF4255 domain-containing protein [Calditrichia bacterium]MCB0288621.1 DUF4255 domain-containing protein [Calditrichota bacterium]MCB0294151.1 DUF4255 domain-containing protein [Calditrichota bacterium]MCB0302455.1 DUF4255 domain-containing protein [Calditrichota bacterium]
MPDYAAIADVSETLKKMLQEGLDSTFGVNQVIVTLDSPKKIEEENNTENKLLSVFLYKVLENSDLKNRPAAVSNSNVKKPTPLSFDLYYMLTPYGADEDNKLKILGRAAQIMYDNAILQGSLLQKKYSGTPEQLKISFTPLTQESIVQTWQALEASMRVAVYYLVTPVEIESLRADSLTPVTERGFGEP